MKTGGRAVRFEVAALRGWRATRVGLGVLPLSRGSRDTLFPLWNQ